MDASSLPSQMSVSDWPEMKETFARTFATKTQAEWGKIFDGTDACVTPVLSLDEVSAHPHNQQRGSFLRDAQGEESPRPAPVLSRTAAQPSLARDPFIGEHTRPVLQDFGFTAKEIEQMEAEGIVECKETKSRL